MSRAGTIVTALAVAALAAATPAAASPAAAGPRYVVLDSDIGAFAAAWSTVDKALYVAGNMPSATGDIDIFLRRYGSDGALVWQRTISTPDSEFARGVAVDPAGAVVLAGSRTSGAGTDALLAKYSARGVRQWVRTYDDWTHGDNVASAVAIDPQGRIWVAGRVPGATEGSSKVWWSRWTASGRMAEQWTAHSSIIGNAEALGIAINGTGVVLAGAVFETVAGQVGVYDDAWIGAFGADGNQLWERTWGRPGVDDRARSVAVDRAGRLYVTGEVSTPDYGDDIVVRRYAPTGRLVWASTISSPGKDSGRGIAVSPDGFTVVVAGTLATDTMSADAFVRAYTSGGGVLWSRTITATPLVPGASTPDGALGVTVPGGIYVVGRQAPATASPQVSWPWVSRLKADDGATLWSSAFDPFG